MSKAADPRSTLSRRGLRWALDGLVLAHLTIARIAEALGVSWNTANDAVPAEGQRVLIDDPHRFDGVLVLGAMSTPGGTRKGDKCVTVIIDLTPVRDDTGPARLLAMVEGRSKQAFKTWLAARPKAWRVGVEVVAMEGFAGFKTATNLIDYPRPSTTGLYYGPRTATGHADEDRRPEPFGGDQRDRATQRLQGRAHRRPRLQFYAGYKRRSELIVISWDGTTVTLTDSSGTPIATHAKPTESHGWHGPTQAKPSTKP